MRPAFLPSNLPNDGYVGLDRWEISSALGTYNIAAATVYGLATSVLKSTHRFNNPVISVLIERIR